MIIILVTGLLVGLMLLSLASVVVSNRERSEARNAKYGLLEESSTYSECTSVHACADKVQADLSFPSESSVMTFTEDDDNTPSYFHSQEEKAALLFSPADNCKSFERKPSQRRLIIPDPSIVRDMCIPLTPVCSIQNAFEQRHVVCSHGESLRSYRIPEKSESDNEYHGQDKGAVNNEPKISNSTPWDKEANIQQTSHSRRLITVSSLHSSTESDLRFDRVLGKWRKMDERGMEQENGVRLNNHSQSPPSAMPNEWNTSTLPSTIRVGHQTDQISSNSNVPSVVKECCPGSESHNQKESKIEILTDAGGDGTFNRSSYEECREEFRVASEEDIWNQSPPSGFSDENFGSSETVIERPSHMQSSPHLHRPLARTISSTTTGSVSSPNLASTFRPSTPPPRSPSSPLGGPDHRHLTAAKTRNIFSRTTPSIEPKMSSASSLAEYYSTTSAFFDSPPNSSEISTSDEDTLGSIEQLATLQRMSNSVNMGTREIGGFSIK